MSPAYCKQVGPWRISKDVIGSGTTSRVHLASHTTIPSLRAAVKIVSRTGLLLKADGDPNALHLADAVIHREVLLMKLASHERIIKLYDFVGHNDLVYMILEHAPNKTLFDLFRSHRSFLPTSLVAHFFSQLMQAIEHLHSLHIVHRDIKLENVFLFGPDIKDVLQLESSQACNHKYKHLLHNAKHTQAHTCNTTSPCYTMFTLKLGDFGLSHTQSPTALSTVFHGSSHYQAPELWARLPHCAFPTDIWSAGVVLFALVGRRLPFGLRELEESGHIFHEDNCDELRGEERHAHVHEKKMDKRPPNCPSPRAGTPLHMPYDALDVIPPAIDHLLQRLFALDPAKRPTAREVLADAFFSGTGCIAPSGDIPVFQGSKINVSIHLVPQHGHADIDEPYDLYDLATLCTPPSIHVPRATFHNSSLERKVRKRLEQGDECIEKMWAGRLKGWVAWEGDEEMRTDNKKRVWGDEKEGESVEKDRRVEWGGRKGWSRSLGRIRGADVRGHLASLGHLGHVGPRERPEHGGHGEMNPPVSKPRIDASLSFRGLKIRTTQKSSEAQHSRPTAHRPSALASTVASRIDATSILQVPPKSLKPRVSFHTFYVKTSNLGHTHPDVQTLHSLAQPPACSALQSSPSQSLSSQHDASIIRSRQEAASALQSRHDALLRRAYELGFGTHDLRAFADEAGRIVQDARVETSSPDNTVRNGEGDVTTSRYGTSSTAATLVPENTGEQKSSVSADMPVVKVVAVDAGRPERALDVDVDVTFDVDFETDSRWM